MGRKHGIFSFQLESIDLKEVTFKECNLSHSNIIV